MLQSILTKLLIFTLLMLSATLLKASEEKINQASFLGLSILNSDLNKVRTQLWSIGGFTQARSTKQKRAVDKFFTTYQLKETLNN